MPTSPRSSLSPSSPAIQHEARRGGASLPSLSRGRPSSRQQARASPGSSPGLDLAPDSSLHDSMSPPKSPSPKKQDDAALLLSFRQRYQKMATSGRKYRLRRNSSKYCFLFQGGDGTSSSSRLPPLYNFSYPSAPPSSTPRHQSLIDDEVTLVHDLILLLCFKSMPPESFKNLTLKNLIKLGMTLRKQSL